MAIKKEAARPRLGRGLAALLGEPETSGAGLAGARTDGSVARAGAIQSLPVEVMEPGPFQPRQDMDPEALAELAASIKTKGILQPILVRPHPDRDGVYQIIAGERRWRASQLAQLHEVPVHVRALDDGDAMVAALVENLQRADLNAIEEAEGLQKLQEDYSLTQEDLAGAIGKSRPHVANTLRLLNLPQSVRGYVRKGELSAGHARALLTHPDPVTAVKAVLAQNLNVRQTEALVAKALKPAYEKPAKANHSDKQSEPEIAALERELATKLGMTVQITFDGKGGSIKIAYRSLDQFDSLLGKLNK